MEVGWGGVSGGGVEWGWWWVGVGLVGVDEGVQNTSQFKNIWRRRSNIAPINS